MCGVGSFQFIGFSLVASEGWAVVGSSARRVTGLARATQINSRGAMRVREPPERALPLQRCSFDVFNRASRVEFDVSCERRMVVIPDSVTFMSIEDINGSGISLAWQFQRKSKIEKTAGFSPKRDSINRIECVVR